MLIAMIMTYGHRAHVKSKGRERAQQNSQQPRPVLTSSYVDAASSLMEIVAWSSWIWMDHSSFVPSLIDEILQVICEEDIGC